VAVVTGASSGIGRELVRQLVRDRGMTVLATARRLERLESLATEFPEGRVVFLAGDIADAEFRRLLWERAEAFPEGVDLLVNNAGIGHYAEFADQEAEIVRRLFEVNVIAPFDLTQRAIRHMKARGGGQILQVSSVLGFFGIPYSATYVATKHAINGLVRSLQSELIGTGVRVWAACPTRTTSEFSQGALGDSGDAGRFPAGEPTDRVVRAIVRGLDGHRMFVYPSLKAHAIVLLAHLLPGPFNWIVSRWGRQHVAEALEAARGRSRAT
jgi:short-subunit dehydrogenase